MSAPSMNQYIVLQVAETRFAIRSDYHVFTKWLTEACADFMALGKPHARLSLSFDITAKGLLPHETSFSIIPRHDDGETNFRVICAAPDKPDKMFRSMLNVCLHCAIVSKHPPDLWMHSSGIVHRGWAYVFSGPSGAGKSTICNILAKESGFTILHDEVIALSQTGEGFRAWSSPLRGERPASYCLGAPLRAVFFLNHAETNHAARLRGGKTPGLLSANVVRLTTTTGADGHLTSENWESLNFILALAGCIPCYELHFKPDFSFWECIEQLFAEQSAIAVRKE